MDALGASRPKKGHPTSVVGMPPRGSKAPAKPTSKLIAHNFLPTLTKPQEVVGSFVVMPGRDSIGLAALQPTRRNCSNASCRNLSKHGKLLDADLGLVVINDGGGGGTSDSHTVMPAATD